MAGEYVICEWNSVQEEYPKFQQAIASLEDKLIGKCNTEWAPKTFGALNVGDGQYGRTTILPALFNGFAGAQLAHWRQTLTTAGHQTLLTGTRAGNTIPEDFKIAWSGIAFPNKQMNISEIRFHIGDTKYGRIDLEELHTYNQPALIFEEGFTIDEEQAFELWGYVKTPDFQRIVLLGACYYKQIDRVLGLPGAAL